MRQRSFLAVAVAVAVSLFVFAAPASATHVQCGHVISTSGTVTLDSDVVCPANTDYGYGIYITANDVRLDLGGHTLRAEACPECSGSVANGIIGGSSSAPLQRVVILNGTIENFQTGVNMGVVDSHIRRLTINNTFNGINISSGDGAGAAGLANCQSGVINCVVRNVVNMYPQSGGTGIQMSGPGSHVWGNVVASGAPRVGIRVTGERARVALNRIESCVDVGIFVTEYRTTYAIVWSNTVWNCGNTPGQAGIVVGNGAEGGNDTNGRVRLNDVTGAWNGIVVYDRNALIAQNDASGNRVDGIYVQPYSGSTFVQENNADNNGSYGINAPDAIDGGGNTASGNAVQQCTPNLTCAP